MSDQQTNIFSRLGKWFKGDSSAGLGAGDLPLLHEEPRANGEPSDRSNPDHIPANVQRTTFLRPWAKRDQAIANLQGGFNALANLLTTVRDNLERQGERQDQLLEYLSHLPEALRQLPESNKVQAETLKAIHQQMEQQFGQQRHLADILDKISDASGSHREGLSALNERVETLHQHDRSISDNLSNVGSAMQDVGKNAEASAKILEQLRNNQTEHDAELQRMLSKQNTRFTTLLATAIFLSIAALVAVALIGYLLLTRAH
jgi:DNA repair exonuclease SbcCD ATPase subunit